MLTKQAYIMETRTILYAGSINGITTCGKDTKMSVITKYRATIGERKDIENFLAVDEKRDAILEYIVACDHPEVYEGEEDEYEQ